MLVEKDDLTLYQLQQVDMSNYPYSFTPPSSNEDSPQPMCNPSPTCFSPSSSDSNNVIISSYGSNYEPNSSTSPYMRIIEQPIDRFRFRYKSEMTGTHGSLCGMNSDKSRKQTYPTIELCNFDKPAIVRCSIYQQNAKDDNMPHAHRLIKKQGKDEVDDPHSNNVSIEKGYVNVFHSMGIIHTAKKNIVPELVRKKTKLKQEEIARLEGAYRELTTKEEVEIKGLAESESKSINLNVVCLRFDAFYVSNGILFPICPPIFSHGINNLKSALTGELKIVRMDHCTSPTKGGREIFILVERVTKKNIKVRFYELDDSDNVLWEDYGKFSDLDVHHQYAIVFKTPPYRDLNITSSVKVYIELERPSDHAKSEPKEFTYVASIDAYKPGAKRLRPNYSSSSYDSSLPSDELPVPINNLCIQTATNSMLLENADYQVNSADFQQALTNINSDEFQRAFHEFWPEYQSVTTDAPVVKYGNNDRSKFGFSFPASRTTTTNKDWSTSSRSKSVAQRYISPEETRVGKTALQELRSFIKTKPTEEKVIVMLHHYLSQNNKTNALHISVKQNDVESVLFLLKLIHVWKQHQLLNIKSDEGETALHIATYCNNEEVINILIPCKADVSVGDSELNTAVHIGVMSNASSEILEKLLSTDNIADFIDNENNDGNTALNLAIENNNLRALKILCNRGADINKRHKKSGFTPMRFAVEKQHIEILKYVLQHSEIDPLVGDFQGVNPLTAAMKKNEEVMELVSEYMRNNDYSDVEVKNEVEDLSEEEEEIEEKFSVKMEQIAQEDLYDMYSTVTCFTPDCLNQVSKILDQSGNWQSLAELLDLGHLMRSNLYDTKSSPSKFLLKLALETNGDTILQIRNFLENLDETRAVEIIDDMVKSQFL